MRQRGRRLDRRLTVAMERYLTDLHDGRSATEQLPRGYVASKRAHFDAGAVLRAALADNRLQEAAREAAPRFAQYERLPRRSRTTARSPGVSSLDIFPAGAAAGTTQTRRPSSKPVSRTRASPCCAIA